MENFIFCAVTVRIHSAVIYLFLGQPKITSFIYQSDREQNTKLFVMESSQCILALHLFDFANYYIT